MKVECPLCGVKLEVEPTRAVVPSRDPAMWDRMQAVLDDHELLVHVE